MQTIFEGHDVRQKKIDHVCNTLRAYVYDGFQVEMSKALVYLIISYFSGYGTHTENGVLIRRIEKKFSEKKEDGEKTIKEIAQKMKNN